MDIKAAVVDDAVLLAELRLAMRREREKIKLDISEDEFLQNNIDYFRQALNDGSYFGVILWIDGAAAATGGICFHNHPPSYSSVTGKSACLLNMYTVPGFRNRGAAGKIVTFLLEHARKKGCAQVFLNASDVGKPLYEKMGFKDVANEMVYTF